MALFGAGSVWIVSKCGKKVQDRSERWLEAHRFFEHTAMHPGNLRFCRERPEKALHCRELEVTHFIDDRLDVLTHLVPIVPHLYLFGHQRRGTVVPRWATRVIDWRSGARALPPGVRSSGSCQERRGATTKPVRRADREARRPDVPLGQAAQTTRSTAIAVPIHGQATRI